MPVPETTFGISYDGPALKEGRMAVRDLAPALLALGDLFSLASGSLYPQLEPVAIKVEATEQGSFFVHLLIEAEHTWDRVMEIFGSKNASALDNLKDAVLGGAGLFVFIQTIRGRRVKARERSVDPGMVKIVLEDGDTLEMPADTWSLYRSIDIRKHTRDVVEPLHREGITTLSITVERDAEPVSIGKDDLASFATIDVAPEALLETQQPMFVEIVAPSFNRTNKWRLSLGPATFWATISDPDFLDRIENGEESFRKGDMLSCIVEVVQTRDAEGLHTEYEVIEVRDHIPRPDQLTFDEPPELPAIASGESSGESDPERPALGSGSE